MHGWVLQFEYHRNLSGQRTRLRRLQSCSVTHDVTWSARLGIATIACSTLLIVPLPLLRPFATPVIVTRAQPAPIDQEPLPDDPESNARKADHGSKRASEEAARVQQGPVPTDWESQYESLLHALIRLPIAAGASAILAFRPRRRGTPIRQTGVVQTQIILAIVGAIVMLVVGVSLARAFGIVGAAGLIRYRAKIDDPKDAGVMLSTLALGLASGVGLYTIVAFGTAFVLGALWLIESIEPEPVTLFLLGINAKDVKAQRPAIEQTLWRHGVRFELRTTSADDVVYEVKVPLQKHTDVISSAITRLDPKQSIQVKWEKEKEK